MDGFTLNDVVSYNEKHNEANGEGNRDATNENHTWNCGVEGPTGDPAVNALRRRQMRNMLATLLSVSERCRGRETDSQGSLFEAAEGLLCASFWTRAKNSRSVAGGAELDISINDFHIHRVCNREIVDASRAIRK